MLECPNRCGGLMALTYEGVEIDLCTVCRGVWLDYGELSEIVVRRERTWSPDRVRKVLSRLAGYNAPPLGEDRDLLCPHCEEVLDEVNYQGTSNIIVNPCSRLHGVWLDAGELVAIQVYMEHWNDYAREHAEEIQSKLKQLNQTYLNELRQRATDGGPSNFGQINELLHDVMLLLEDRRQS